jgi:hypothetical protein
LLDCKSNNLFGSFNLFANCSYVCIVVDMAKSIPAL